MEANSEDGQRAQLISPAEVAAVCGTTPSWLLLTGAGFSANWGAPVSLEMWSEIIGDARLASAPSVRRALLSGEQDGFNFETVLIEAQEGEFGQEESRIYHDIVYTAFGRIEEILHRNGVGQLSVDMTAFFEEFAPTSNEETGFVFTLNQDLLLERQFKVGHGNVNFRRPGVEDKDLNSGFTEVKGVRYPISFTSPVYVDTLSNAIGIDALQMRGRTNYLKLHGSVDWIGKDSENSLIVGGGKRQRIQSFWLLNVYFELFRWALFQGDKSLMILGYGFADDHVNAILAEGVKYHDLKIHIWDVRSPKEIYGQLSGEQKEIWSGLIGYTQKPLSRYINFGKSQTPRSGDCEWFLNQVFHPYPGEQRQAVLPALTGKNNETA